MRKTKQRTDLITAADVRGIRFPLIRRGGYDPRQVDPFLELVARSLEGGPDGGPKVDAQYVHSVRFATVRRGGYAPTAVDAFLDQVIDTIDPPDGVVADQPQLVGAAAAGAAELAPSAAPVAPLSASPDIAPPAPIVTDAPPPPPPPPPPAATTDAPVEEPAPVVPDPTTEAQPLVANGVTVTSVPENPSALEIGRAHLERLKVLYEAGVLSDKEVTVLAQRVKRRAREQHQLSQN